MIVSMGLGITDVTNYAPYHDDTYLGLQRTVKQECFDVIFVITTTKLEIFHIFRLHAYLFVFLALKLKTFIFGGKEAHINRRVKGRETCPFSRSNI